MHVHWIDGKGTSHLYNFGNSDYYWEIRKRPGTMEGDTIEEWVIKVPKYVESDSWLASQLAVRIAMEIYAGIHDGIEEDFEPCDVFDEKEYWEVWLNDLGS